MGDNCILIVGSIGLDTIETPTQKQENLIGGSTTYSLIAASRNIPVSIVGIIGKDFPDEGHLIFNTYATNLEDLQIVKGKTFRWGGRYHENWDDRDTLYTELGVFSDFKPVLSDSNKNRSHILLANIHPDLQQSIIQQNNNKDALIIVDTMNLWINTARDSLINVLSNSNILLLNESEARELTEKENLSDSASAILAMGLDTVVIKKGSNGAELFSKHESFSVGAYPIKKVVDPTGAGDTFGGGFISALACGKTIKDSLIYGSSLASLCVEGFGTDKIQKISESAIEDRFVFLKSTVKS